MNGKGDSPRNVSKKFRDNFDGINWGQCKMRFCKFCNQWKNADSDFYSVGVSCAECIRKEIPHETWGRESDGMS
jgi:hypothetical protein